MRIFNKLGVVILHDTRDRAPEGNVERFLETGIQIFKKGGFVIKDARYFSNTTFDINSKSAQLAVFWG